MRTITAELATAQAVRSPRWGVTVTAGARGTNPDMPALHWRKLTYAGASPPAYPSAGFDTSSGAIQRFKANAAGIWQQTVTNPADANEWRANAWTNIHSDVASAMCAYRHATTSARLYYIAGGNVYYLRTSDDGVSWLARLALYTGGNASSDLCISRAPVGHAVAGNVVGFSTYASGTGVYAAYFNAGSTVKYADYWRAAGVFFRSDDVTHVYCLVFRQTGAGPARLRVVKFDGSAFSGARDIDQTQAGLFGINLACYKFCGIPGSNLLIGSAVESAYTGESYEGVASGFGQGGILGSAGVLADEPVIFPEIRAWSLKNYSYIVRSGSDYYYFGEDHVWRGEAMSAPTETLIPVRYVYDDGQIEIEFEQGPGGSPGGPLGEPSRPLCVGHTLTVRRTVSWGSVSGYEDLAFSVVRVARSRRGATVLAVDAVGYLGVARCRRPAVLNDGSAAGVAQVLRDLGARCGLGIACDDGNLESAEVMPVTVQPSESLLGAAYRVSSQTDVYLVPAGDGTFTAEMINPPVSDSGEHDDTAHVYPNGEGELIAAEAVSDYRRLAFAYVLGTASTDPEDGGFVGMAAGPVLPNTRPLSYSLTNTRYNTDDRVLAAAGREAERQKKLTVDAVITAPANLALELYDVVKVTEPLLGWNEKAFRVRRIREVWERGRLTQTLYLGDRE